MCVPFKNIYKTVDAKIYSPVCFWISDPEAAAASKTAPIFISRPTTLLGDIWRENFFPVKTAARKIFFVKTQQQKTEKMNFAVSVSTILTMLIKTNSKTLLLILIFLAISTDAHKQDFYECVPGIKSPGGKFLLWIMIFIFWNSQNISKYIFSVPSRELGILQIYITYIAREGSSSRSYKNMIRFPKK